MNIFNLMVTGLFKLLFLPFRSLDPIWALSVISLLAGVLMLWIFGKVSDQETIRTVRDQIRGNLIGIRLFGDEIGILFKLQGRVMLQTLNYLRHALLPMIIMIIPVIVILIQLNLWFTARPLEPGEKATVKVTLRDESAVSEGVTLETQDGVTVETPGVRIPSLREVAWRIRADEPGRYLLSVKAGQDQVVEKELLVGRTWDATSSLRTGAGIVDNLLYPGERSIPSESKIEAIEILYPALKIRTLGWNIDWMIFFFVASIVFGFAFKGVLGVEI